MEVDKCGAVLSRHPLGVVRTVIVFRHLWF